MKMSNHFTLPILVDESFDYDYMGYCEDLYLIDDQAHAAAHAINIFDDLVLQLRNAVGILKSCGVNECELALMIETLDKAEVNNEQRNENNAS